MPKSNGRDRALEMAFQAAGGQIEIARFITKRHGPISAQAINKWRRCPADRVLQVEAATKGRVSRYRLRPDIYPRGA